MQTKRKIVLLLTSIMLLSVPVVGMAQGSGGHKPKPKPKSAKQVNANTRMKIKSKTKPKPESDKQRMITTGMEGGHKWVDLGLSVCWADCNLGAINPSESGKLFNWGIDISSKETVQNGIKNICGTRFDIASQLLGNSWRLPTKNELEELVDNCISYEDMENGIKGLCFTGVTGNSIFVPYTDGEKEKNYTTIWSGEQTLFLHGIGWKPLYKDLSQLGDETLTSVMQISRYVRGVVNNNNRRGDMLYWGIPKNGEYLIKGQVVSGDRIPLRSVIKIYDNRTNDLLCILDEKNKNKIFEMWVHKDQELRFEDADDAKHKPVVMKAKPLMIVEMWKLPTFGLG